MGFGNMQIYEYRVVPAPKRSKRIKGVKGTAGRFAAILMETMNEQAVEGWEYLRSDSLPVEEKPGLLKSRVETYQTVLVFRREIRTALDNLMVSRAKGPSNVEEIEHQDAKRESGITQEPHATPEAFTTPDARAEPAVSSEWSKNNDYTDDPPLTSHEDDEISSQKRTI
ncbi:MAG TPA: hypothetical protein DCF96_13260 [Rhodobacteraceae bacterium]|nr:hypothetical protein [Paracoccaceae bacterium]